MNNIIVSIKWYLLVRHAKSPQNNKLMLLCWLSTVCYLDSEWLLKFECWFYLTISPKQVDGFSLWLWNHEIKYRSRMPMTMPHANADAACRCLQIAQSMLYFNGFKTAFHIPAKNNFGLFAKLKAFLWFPGRKCTFTVSWINSVAMFRFSYFFYFQWQCSYRIVQW